MSDTSHLLPPWSVSAQSPSLSKPLQQMLPFHIRDGKISFFFFFPLHVRFCRYDNLRRWTVNVTSTRQPIAFLFTGRCGSVMGSAPMTLGLSRCAHMNENESAGLAGAARRGLSKMPQNTRKQYQMKLFFLIWQITGTMSFLFYYYFILFQSVKAN